MAQDREIPMLFSTAMVQALLAGTKTETRRTGGLKEINQNPFPDAWKFVSIPNDKTRGYTGSHAMFRYTGSGETRLIKLPCQPGDQIWVRETFAFYKWDEPQLSGAAIERIDYFYKASHLENNITIKWKPSLFMPREACRIRLEVIDVRVERLHDITDEGAINEGILEEAQGSNIKPGYVFHDYSGLNRFLSPTASYQTLWESINGKGSWMVNPFCWVIKFKITNK